MRLIECRCGRTLGVVNTDGSITQQYKGRESHFWPPARLKCQNCGFTKAIDKDREPVVQ